MIYCILSSGISLNDEIRNVLFDTAQEMFLKEKRRKKIKSLSCEGFISTEGKRASLGGISGTVFNAEIETTWGKVVVEYIVREADFRSEELTWVSVKDDPKACLN